MYSSTKAVVTEVAIWLASIRLRFRVVQTSSGVAERNGCGVPFAGAANGSCSAPQSCGVRLSAGPRCGVPAGRRLFRSVCFRILEPIDGVGQVRHCGKLSVPFARYLYNELGFELEDEFDGGKTVYVGISDHGWRMNPFGWYRTFRGYQLR